MFFYIMRFPDYARNDNFDALIHPARDSSGSSRLPFAIGTLANSPTAFLADAAKEKGPTLLRPFCSFNLKSYQIFTLFSGFTYILSPSVISKAS
ncbi:hypothetical protein JM83_0900 [Gillisia sp. Hel_I_86]|nr:hypothetical protein JM83_0900 [Gillisia sp. Hel_I_86]